MVRVERVGVGVGDEDVGRERADRVGDGRSASPSTQRVVAEVEGAERGAERRRRGLRLGVAERLTLSSVWPSSFHSSPDSPRSP